MGLADASIQYWNGTDFTQLQDTGWDNFLTSMDVAWKDDNMPQIVLGLDNGDVFFYDNGWSQIRTVECSSWCGIFKIKAQFFTKYLRVVMATEDAAVWYYDEEREEKWEELHDGTYESLPYGFCARFPLSTNTDAYPDVVIGLESGAIERMNSQKSWSQIQEMKSYGVDTMECNFLQENEEDLRFVVSFNDGSVGLYPLSNTCGDVDLIQGTGWNNVMSVISASFHPSGNIPPRFVGGLNILQGA